jgi:glycerophosphoryl diester phosphodiesterase
MTSETEDRSPGCDPDAKRDAGPGTAAGTPIVYGHRGMSRLAPENTLAAFALIRQNHIPGVELDIHQCATGELVVAHDDDLIRTAGAGLVLRESPLEAIREHDVGSWFAEEFRDQRVPTLEEVFELLGDGVYYDIEIKPFGIRLGKAAPRGIEVTLEALISRHGLAGRCLVSSFDPLIIRRFTGVTRTISTALIYSSSKEIPFAARRGRGLMICRPTDLKPHFKDVTASSVARQTNRGRRVIPWTVDDPSEALRLAAAGVHGLISNVPDVILAALQA